MAVTTLHDLFVDELRDIYYAEKRLLKALPKMAKKATSSRLQDAFKEHLEETEGQVERIEAIFDELDLARRGKRCEAMLGLIEEGTEMMEEVEKGPLLDAALITAAQKVEHYEMASYGSLVALGEQLGLGNPVKLLKETLEQEKTADSKLNALATGGINKAAA